MRRATPILILTVLAALAGCGDSSSPAEPGSGSTEAPKADTTTAPAGASARSCQAAGLKIEDLRATVASCGEARGVASGWLRARECVKRPGLSRSPCSLGSYRCVATATDRGWSVGCAQPGRSIAFTRRR
jgi:hypothetical protein